jgi:hypothetical protein
MRFIFAILMGFAVQAVQAAQPGFHGQILSYKEIVRMKPSVRREYFRDLARLVSLMEKSEKQFDIASNSSLEQLKEQVAMMMRLFDVLPEASANVNAVEDTPADKSPSEKAPPAEKAEAAAAASAPAPACVAPGDLQCKKIPDTPEGRAAKKKMIGDFRKSSNRKECIVSGFFSSYKNGENRPGNCDIKYSFPKDQAEHKISCTNGKALCNPLLFCLGVDLKISKDGKDETRFIPDQVCVKPGQNMTAECEQIYQQKMGGEALDLVKLKKVNKRLYESARKEKARACDPEADLKDFAFKDEFDNLKKSIETKYRDLCSGDLNFQALFCKECEVIGQHIFAMNEKTGHNGCGDPLTGASRADQGASGQPAGTDAEH